MHLCLKPRIFTDSFGSQSSRKLARHIDDFCVEVQNKRDKLNPDKALSTLDVQRQLAKEQAAAREGVSTGQGDSGPAAGKGKEGGGKLGAAGRTAAAVAGPASAQGVGGGGPGAVAGNPDTPPSALHIAPRLNLGSARQIALIFRRQ